MAKSINASKIIVLLLPYLSLAYIPAQDCINYKDSLIFGLDYPGRVKSELHSCVSPKNLHYHLKRVFKEEINGTITKMNHTIYQDSIVLLSPITTLPLLPSVATPAYTFPRSGRTMDEDTMHIIRSTNIKKSIWNYEGGFHKFSEVIIEDYNYEPTNSCDDVRRKIKEIRFIDSMSPMKRLDLLQTHQKIRKVIIIMVINNITPCLKLRLVHDKPVNSLDSLNDNYKNFFKTANGSSFNPYMTVSRLYHTTLEAVFPNYDRINNMETSTPPWIDDIRYRNSTWCRSHRYIWALSDFVFEFGDEATMYEPLEYQITGPCHCSFLMFEENRFREILMEFLSWNFTLVLSIPVDKNGAWWLSHMDIRQYAQKKEQLERITFPEQSLGQNQTSYKENIHFTKWNKKTFSSPHLRIGISAVEFHDYGVGYNFSNPFSRK